jgi:hypothetical protein
MIRRLRFVVYFFILVSSSSFAQEADNCEITLNKAIEEFNAGHFNSISGMLNDCLDKFSREQRERAYMLLTQTYLLLDDPFGAEKSYLSLLQANPEFIADENRDPIDVVYLSKKFTATPIFSWYVNIGANISTIKELNSHKTVTGDFASKKYSIRPGMQLGGGLEYNFNDNIVAGVELNYAFTSFRVGQLHHGANEIEAIDKQNWFNIPIIAKYVWNKGKIRPYGYLGYSFNFLFRDVIAEKTINDGNFTTSKSPDLPFTDHRRQFNRSFIFGGGLKYKFGLDYFFADARFAVGMTNLSKSGMRFPDPSVSQSGSVSGETEIFSYAYLDDDFRMNNVFISVGFVHPLYKPRKLKKARTKSVLRKIGKQEDEGQN